MFESVEYDSRSWLSPGSSTRPAAAIEPCKLCGMDVQTKQEDFWQCSAGHCFHEGCMRAAREQFGLTDDICPLESCRLPAVKQTATMRDSEAQDPAPGADEIADMKTSSRRQSRHSINPMLSSVRAKTEGLSLGEGQSSHSSKTHQSRVSKQQLRHAKHAIAEEANNLEAIPEEQSVHLNAGGLDLFSKVSASPKLQSKLALADTLELFDATYGTTDSLTVSGTRTGEALDRRLMTKAYGRALLEVIAAQHCTKQNANALREGYSTSELSTSLIGRIPEYTVKDGSAHKLDVIASSTKASRLQAVVFYTGQTPFAVLDLGNNTNLGMLTPKKSLNLGTYQTGGASDTHLPAISLVHGKNDPGLFVISGADTEELDNLDIEDTNHVIFRTLPTNQNPDHAAVEKADGLAVLKSLANLAETADSKLATTWLKNLNAYRETCGLESIESLDSSLLHALQRMHTTTVNSIAQSRTLTR